MKILACDTSTLMGSVAVSSGSQVIASRSSLRAGSHTDTINKMITDCLDEAGLSLKDIDVFCSGLGPGSFTGIRISLNTIKTLAYIHQKPACGLDSLLMMADLVKQKSEFITPMINAFKNMVYTAEYKSVKNELVMVKPPQVVRVQDLISYLNPQSLIVGDGYATYETYLKANLPFDLMRQGESSDFPLANTLCHIFGQKSLGECMNQKYHWSQLVPIYLRASEAEENLNGIKFQPL
ncbi:MAG: tRNA (adenosine(37)-N6)-threonylcarbamoyltransferase complex dimerization subunit type 1 TsaB [Moraxellaceae bacterium]|nr:tRNA (adenosine(37)-N6)-threonylcarbamoyltransferase complex dimerization subunit type 1 TsaB [Pseudobdellovibrionaceae bacterium]